MLQFYIQRITQILHFIFVQIDVYAHGLRRLCVVVQRVALRVVLRAALRVVLRVALRVVLRVALRVVRRAALRVVQAE